MATFWFVSHDNSGNLVCAGKTCTSTNELELCWTKDGSKEPAIEISIYYDNSGFSYASPNNFSNLKVKRFNFNPPTVSKPSRHFITATINCGIGSQYDYSTDTYFNNLDAVVDSCVDSATPCLIAAKVRVLDNGNVGQKVALQVKATAELPSQGVLISSTGTSGDSTRKVNVLQGYPEPPDVFEGVLYSGGDLSQ